MACMNQAGLKKLVSSSPLNPGVYTFSGSNGKILYIGKASNLKSRLNSYLKTDDSRIQKMIDSARSLKLLKTDSDIEALILESRLIKKFRPQFNIMMRDDKQYFYVGFTKETFPKIFLTHQPNQFLIFNYKFLRKSKNSKFKINNSKSAQAYFVGPFTDGNTLKSTLRFLRRIFPYCTCKQLHNNFCLNYHIGKCLGYCCLKKPEPQGSTLKKSQGRTLDSYRKNIKAIKNILSGKKESLMKNLEKDMARLAKKGALEKAIELRDKITNLKRIFENARLIKNSDILKAYRSELESLLKIQKPIIRIEGYDISNIQGANATGSMVTFINGRPDKNFYRKFKIYGKRTPDDTAMLREVLERRLKHEEWPFPDLILIDGGKGQVNTAVKTLNKMAVKIPVVGISKNERHVGHQLIIPGQKSASWRTFPLTKLPPADRSLLLTIDSEAHRFAISYYRKLHRKFLK